MSDLISRQAALEIIKEHSYPVMYDRNSIEQGMTITGIEQALNEVPTVQPEQKPGRWVPHKHTDTVLCSQCGKCYGEEYNYCPNCGAKMRDGE